MSFKAICCATQGRSHIKTNTPCQDKTFALITPNFSAIALADGAGSAKYSHFGAEIATKFICKILERHFMLILQDADSAKVDILNALLGELQKEAQFRECALKDLASTLLCVGVCNDIFIAFHLGDGLICALDSNEMRLISGAQNGEFANTTFFTTSQNAWQKAEIIIDKMDNINAFALMSDGVAPSFYNERSGEFKALKGILQKSLLISQDKMQERMQQTMDNVLVKATFDDCSLAILARNDEFLGYSKLTGEQKKWLFEMEGSAVNYTKIRNFDKIIMSLESPKEFDEILQTLQSKTKYFQRCVRIYLQKLCEIGAVSFDGKKYSAQIAIK
ncbi:PP2C family serine/threonine-protein phosphatase [Helicobacter sp. 23-1045]